MKFRDFIKDKVLLIVTVILALISIEILLLAYNIGIIAQIYIAIIIILVVGISIFVEYKNKQHFYNQLKANMDELNEKYLISEIIKTPNFIEGKILKETIQDTGKSMLENVNYYKNIQEEYKEYIELWIHEVKIPIAASKMIIENNKNSVTKSIDEELDKVENYIEQALFYARSNAVEKDYIINKTNLKEIVSGSILKNKTTLLIIQNANNGIGIKKGEITRVFERGFTGENGRIVGQKSTGIGLYLCKRLCDKLGLGIELNSEKDIGTEVRIIFPKNSYTIF